MVANIFGKIFAQKMKLQAQSRCSQISRTIAKLTRNISRAEKAMAQSKRMEINYIKQSFSIFNQGNLKALAMKNPDFAGLFTANGGINYEFAKANQAAYDEYNQYMQTTNMMAQSDMQAQLDMIEQKYEMLQEIEIEAMKEEQADLQAELETEKANIQIYEGMEKQEGEFAKNNIQNMFQA